MSEVSKCLFWQNDVDSTVVNPKTTLETQFIFHPRPHLAFLDIAVAASLLHFYLRYLHNNH